MKVSGSLALLQMADSGTLTGEIELDGRKITCEMVTDAARDPIKITYMTDTQYFSKMTDFSFIFYQY